MIELYYFSLLVLLSTFIYVSFLDLKERRVPFKYWYPLIIIGSISTIIFLISNIATIDAMTVCILITTLIVFWLCGYIGLMGGADAWAMIFITLFTISVPFNPLLDNVKTGIAISTYINALIVSFILYPIYNYIINKINGVSAPWYYMILTQRISGKDVTKKYGYILPDAIQLLNIKDFFTQYKDMNKLIYTKLLINEPDKYKEDILIYNNYKYIWLVNAVPFIVYITIGLFITLIIGDLYEVII